MKDKKTPENHLPSREDILNFLRDNPGRTGKREIARAFNIKGGDRIWLKQVLREMTAEGLIEHSRRDSRIKGELPPVAIVEITGTDPDGELEGRILHRAGEGVRVVIAPGRHAAPAPGPGDRFLARLQKQEENLCEARLMRRIARAPAELLGTLQRENGKTVLRGTDRKGRSRWIVPEDHLMGAGPGDLVLAEPLEGSGPRQYLARITKVLGNTENPRVLSLIAIHDHGIPTVFPDEVLAEAAAKRPVRSMRGREDLCPLPLITIDPADARDHDDAVWAAADDDPANKGGWKLIVAIADVAHYVTPGSALDREALKRGNSTYFPDRVVPMLPEKLSGDLCSLHPGVKRPCMAVHIRIDAGGRKIEHRFSRAMMRSAANLTYQQAQAIADGQNPPLADMDPDAPARLREEVVGPLFSAYRALARARDARGPLAIDIPERQVKLSDEGEILSVAPRERLDAHRLIEEFMVLANVCAAETLEAARKPCMYRVHEEPKREKLVSLKTFLKSIGISFSIGQVIRPSHFNRVLKQVEGSEYAEMVNQVILRCQTQAYYSPENLGHFGLALPRYAHFTSPIRRYADLLVHRGLIAALGLGKDGLRDEDGARFAETGRQISDLERRSMAAERAANDRFLAAFMKDRIGGIFAGRISGVTRFGLFVTLEESGADGLVPIRSLGHEYFRHDEDHHCLIGERSGKTYRLAQKIDVRLLEATPIAGGLLLEIVENQGQTGKDSAETKTAAPLKKKKKKKDKHSRRKGRPRRARTS